MSKYLMSLALDAVKDVGGLEILRIIDDSRLAIQDTLGILVCHNGQNLVLPISNTLLEDGARDEITEYLVQRFKQIKEG